MSGWDKNGSWQDGARNVKQPVEQKMWNVRWDKNGNWQDDARNVKQPVEQKMWNVRWDKNGNWQGGGKNFKLQYVYAKIKILKPNWPYSWSLPLQSTEIRKYTKVFSTAIVFGTRRDWGGSNPLGIVQEIKSWPYEQVVYAQPRIQILRFKRII